MDAGWTPLMESASRADLGISRALLEGGADPNKAVKQAVTSRRSTTPDLLLLFLEFGYSPQKLFYEAVWSGRPKDVRVLLDKVDLNEPDASGRFPLVLASLNSAGMVRLLLAHGADPGKIPPDRRHPLILCASRGYLKPLRALLQTWHSDEVLETALVQACSRGRFRCVLALLKAGANVNSSLGTPLMAAADQGSLALVNLLLERGADPDLVDEAGKTARDYALEFTSADFFKKSVEEIGGQPARHRWTTDPVTGEPILQLRVGRQIYRRTNCHKAIVSRFSQVVTGPE
ncbi:MAG: ankyrin repeat domain-containing protein [Vulcanimicrobiota bacterium]